MNEMRKLVYVMEGFFEEYTEGPEARLSHNEVLQALKDNGHSVEGIEDIKFNSMYADGVAGYTCIFTDENGEESQEEILVYMKPLADLV